MVKDREKSFRSDDPEKLHNIRGVWRQFECLLYHILASLTSIKELFSPEEANELVNSIFDSVAIADQGDFNENSLKYRALRRHLYTKIKEVNITELRKQENTEIKSETTRKKKMKKTN